MRKRRKSKLPPRSNLRASLSRRISTASLIGVLTLGCVVVLFGLESARASYRLSNAVVQRASQRRSTKDDALVTSLDTSPTSTREFQTQLRERAERLLDERAFGDATRDAVERGLRRWNLNDARDCSSFLETRRDDRRATREALEVFEDLEGDADDALDAAIQFLSELDVDDRSNDETFALWSFDVVRGDPMSSVGIVSRADFEPTLSTRLSERAREASTRLFFLLTLGAFVFSRPSVSAARISFHFLSRFARANLLEATGRAHATFRVVLISATLAKLSTTRLLI